MYAGIQNKYRNNAVINTPKNANKLTSKQLIFDSFHVNVLFRILTVIYDREGASMLDTGNLPNFLSWIKCFL